MSDYFENRKKLHYGTLQGLITKDKYFLNILLCVSAFTDY